MNLSKQKIRVNKLSLKKQYLSQRSTSLKDNTLISLWNFKTESGVKEHSESEIKVNTKSQVKCSYDSCMPPAKKLKVCNENELKIKVSSEEYSDFSLFCPNCQIPFSALIGQTQRWHMDECMDVNYQDLKECPDGSFCNSNIPSHYTKYSHFCLAALRSGLDAAKEEGTKSLPIIPFMPESEKVYCLTKNSPLKHKQDSDVKLTLLLKNLKQKEENINKNSELSEEKSEKNGAQNEIYGNAQERDTKSYTIFNYSKSDSTIHMVDQELINSLNKKPLLYVKNDFYKIKNMENYNENNQLELECSKNIGMTQNNKSEIALDLNNSENNSKDNIVIPFTESNITAFQLNSEAQIEPLDLFLMKKKQVTITSFFKSPTKNINEGENKFSSVKATLSSASHQNKSLTNKLISRMPIMPNSRSEWNLNSDKSNNLKGIGRQRKVCPFYKKIPDTTFCVDAFNYGTIPGIKHYFLSHFHSDHYCGLTRHFNYPIYCSLVTANLVALKIHLPQKYLYSLELNDPVIIDGVEVTLLDANHCPGSVMFLFCLTDGRRFLHTGDFRATPTMELYGSLKNNNIQRLYLDTTYCNPRYNFPSQDVILNLITSLVVQRIKLNSKILIVCGSYTIGKERVFMAIAETINCKIWANKTKLKILECLEDEKIKSHLVEDAKLAQVHILPMNQLTIALLRQYLLKFVGIFNEVIGLKPTGWEHRSQSSRNLDTLKPICSGSVSVYGIPYSEHSSFNELQRFVQFIRPNIIIPTVNVGSAKSRREMDNIFQKWL